MKILLSLAAVVAFSVVPALAGDGRVSDQSLAKMGLSGMKSMSDVQGMKLRGLSVEVGGFSIASISGAGGSAASVNSYYASGKHEASGENLSVAGDVTTTITTHGTHVTTTTTVNIVAAGGFSSASAH